MSEEIQPATIVVPESTHQLVELLAAADRLMEIVEGVRGCRWNACGRRLVDTPEWANFYVTTNKLKREIK